MYSILFSILSFVKISTQVWNSINLLMSTHITSHFFFCFIQLDSLSTWASDNCEILFSFFFFFLLSLSKFKRGRLIWLCSFGYYYESSSTWYCSLNEYIPYYFNRGTCCFPLFTFSFPWSS